MKKKRKLSFVTIVPSPYQRDLFGALAKRDEIELSVYYLEASVPESPWPEKDLRPFEKILPGFSVTFGNVRAHMNWPLPDFAEADVVVLSSYSSFTGQLLMRSKLRGRRWLYWGEQMRPQRALKHIVQTRLAAPLAKATGIVAIGSAADRDYRNRFPHVEHHSIPYHCDLTKFMSIQRNSDVQSPMTFLFCGQMIERKAVDVLLLAFDRLISIGMEARLLLVGREAELPTFMELVGAKTKAKIQYEGFQAPESLPRYFAQADVFVLPSRHDGWGVVVNQALAAGLPIVVSNAVGAGLDYVEDGTNGVRVAAGSVDELYKAMKSLIANPGMAREWGVNSRDLARTLTPESGADKWVQVIDTLMANEGKVKKVLGAR
jgi:glycosyltransferase involved in cell wall biosynthesis